MVEKLAANPRKGNLAETLGTLLLQGVASVAPIPRTEDVGIDAVATLLRQDKLTLFAENSFNIQFKAASVKQLVFEDNHVKWLLSLELPFFVGSVDLSAARIDLFACHRLTQAIIEGHDYKSIVLDLEGSSEQKEEPKNGRRLCIGPPVLSWSVNDMSDKDFIRSSYAVLKPHLTTYQRNLELGRCGRFEQLAWETSRVPELVNVQMMAGPDTLQTAMSLALPYISACLLDLNGTGELELFDKLREVAAGMCDLGATPDPIIEEIGKLRDKKKQ